MALLVLKTTASRCRPVGALEGNDLHRQRWDNGSLQWGHGDGALLLVGSGGVMCLARQTAPDGRTNIAKCLDADSCSVSSLTAATRVYAAQDGSVPR